MRRRCNAHLINDGVTVVANSDGVLVNKITWATSGREGLQESQSTYRCRLDGGSGFDCE